MSHVRNSSVVALHPHAEKPDDFEIGFRIERLLRRIRRQFDDSVSGGLQYKEWLLLRAISVAEGQSFARICAENDLNRGSVTPLLKKLIQKSCVIRSESNLDRRTDELWLTQRGRDCLSDGSAILSDIDAWVLDCLTAAERMTLKSMLSNLGV